jgi:hypothetical protein
MRQAGFSRLGLVLGSILSLQACSGGGGDGTDAGSGPGTVTAPWTDFCTATFTESTPVLDPFDEPTFTANAGDEFLLSEFNTAYSEIVYLTNAGPDPYVIDQNANGDWPFTSNCTAGDGVPYYAVFEDVSVYAEETLSTKICDLAAGTALPAAGGARGYLLTGGLSLEGPATYEIYLDVFSSQCAGNDTGYISVPETHVFGSDTWLVPIIGIIAPN